jgi:hypothetical protein
VKVTRERLIELLQKLFWTNADFREVTGWHRNRVTRWKQRLGLRDRETYLTTLERVAPEFCARLRAHAAGE